MSDKDTCTTRVFRVKIPLCSSRCLATHLIDKVGLELTELNLPLPPKCGIKGVGHHTLLYSYSALQTERAHWIHQARDKSLVLYSLPKKINTENFFPLT